VPLVTKKWIRQIAQFWEKKEWKICAKCTRKKLENGKICKMPRASNRKGLLARGSSHFLEFPVIVKKMKENFHSLSFFIFFLLYEPLPFLLRFI